MPARSHSGARQYEASGAGEAAPVQLAARAVADPAALAPVSGTHGASRTASGPGLLDLHEGIDDPRGGRGCGRWPEALRLLNRSTGELVVGRCRATNLCRYCQRLYVVETVEMLSLDAVEYAPTLWLVLTAREHLTRAECRRHLNQLLKAARRRWPGAEWFVQVEFQRRGALHLNLLVKGVPVESADALLEVVSEVWCARVDAEPVGQWSGAIEDAEHTVRYLSKMLAHGLKAEQAPPIGWRGHRTSQTRGYLVRPASVMRLEARRALRLKRLIYAGLDATTAELELQLRDSEDWSLVHSPARLSWLDALVAERRAEGGLSGRSGIVGARSERRQDGNEGQEGDSGSR
jgi:hypothetical protein